MICPAQVDTCTEDLLRDAFKEASKHDLPYQIHAAQSLAEFHEIVRRHGKTPIEWLDSLGVLSPARSSVTASFSMITHGRIGPRPMISGRWPEPARRSLIVRLSSRAGASRCATLVVTYAAASTWASAQTSTRTTCSMK
jgi:Amidohydrolase family